MSDLPVRRTERLHRGRVSAQGATYYVTFVTKNRAHWLASQAGREAVITTLRDWHNEGDGAIRAAVVMPDHVHVLSVLGRKLTIGRCVSRWKNKSQKASGNEGKWQRDFWEHRVRTGESMEDYGLYMLLNPYRAGLVSAGASWPGWWWPDPNCFRFASALDEGGTPPRDWRNYPEDRFRELGLGKESDGDE